MSVRPSAKWQTDRRRDQHHPGDRAKPEDEQIQSGRHRRLDGGEDEQRYRRRASEPVDDADDQGPDESVGPGHSKPLVESRNRSGIVPMRMRLRIMGVRMSVDVIAVTVHV